MVAFNYEKEISYRGIKFKKDEIFYRDKNGEWGRWGIYWWRILIFLYFFVGSLVEEVNMSGTMVITALLFRGTRPRDARLFVNKGYIGLRGGKNMGFRLRGNTKLLKREKVEEVIIFDGGEEVKIYEKAFLSEKSLVGRIEDVGKIDKFVSLLKEYGYPIKIIDKEEEDE